MLAGSFDTLAGQVIRIGHMGSNANVTDMSETFGALNDTLEKLGVSLKRNIREVFEQEI